jgi:hypothetical protein
MGGNQVIGFSSSRTAAGFIRGAAAVAVEAA